MQGPASVNLHERIPSPGSNVGLDQTMANDPRDPRTRRLEPPVIAEVPRGTAKMERPNPQDLQSTIAMQPGDRLENADADDLHRTVAMNVVVPPAGAPLPAPLAKAALQSTIAFTPPKPTPQALAGTMAMTPEQHAAQKAQALALVQAHQQQQQQKQPHPGSQPPMPAAAPYVPPHVQQQQQQQAHLAAQHAHAQQARAQQPVMKPCTPTADPRLMMLSDPKGAQASSFRLLRDTLVAKGLPRVLAVSSCASEDGTTTCAVNLALALGEHPTEKLLLVDANFASPALGELLGAEAGPAEGAAPWCAPFTVSALSATVHVATVARQPGQSQSYVDLTTFKRLLESFFRAGYQHIIIDMPPVESSPEAALLMHLAGGVLLAVRSGTSTTGALRKAVDRIGEKALGVALMDA